MVEDELAGKVVDCAQFGRALNKLSITVVPVFCKIKFMKSQTDRICVNGQGIGRFAHRFYRPEGAKAVAMQGNRIRKNQGDRIRKYLT